MTTSNRTPNVIDVTATFASRLANLLRAARGDSGRSLRQLARASRGQFSVAQLRAAEAATLPLENVDLRAITRLYGARLAVIVPSRQPLTIYRGRIEAGIGHAEFTPGDDESLLVAYLLLVRDLRGAQRDPTVALRRGDIDTLAARLEVDGSAVIERLGQLMGSTGTQRRAATAMFVAGEPVITLASSASPATSPPSGSTATS